MRKSVFHLTALSAVLSLLVCGCTEEPLAPAGETSEDKVVFNVEVSSPTEDGATFLITNNGQDRNTWYGFAYDDTDTPVQAAINRTVHELGSMEGGFTDLLERGSKRIRITDGLKSATKYRYVVFGLTKEGTIYGKPASCEFKTEHSAIKFKIAVSGETSSSVSLSVEPSGEGTWYCFVSEDSSTSAEELCGKEVEGLKDIESVLKSGKKTVTFESLKAGKKLLAVATGLDADGKIYGTPQTLEFRLTPDPVLNENWSVTYDGLVTPAGADKAYRKVTNTSSDNERYFINVVSEDNLATVYNNDINAYIKAAVSELTARYPTNWSRYVFTGTSSIYYTLRTRKSYFAFAIGIDRNGYFTGNFAISDKFHIDGKDWSAVYDKWLGKWEAVDNYGHGYSITIAEDSRKDFTFNITGWNNVTDTPIHGVIDDETGKLYISGYNYGEHDLVTKDGTVKVTKMLVGLAGRGYYGISDDNSDAYYICACDLDSEGRNATMKGLTISTSSGTQTFSQMFYIGVVGSTVYTYGDQSTFPTFPCKLGRAGL